MDCLKSLLHLPGIKLFLCIFIFFWSHFHHTNSSMFLINPDSNNWPSVSNQKGYLFLITNNGTYFRYSKIKTMVRTLALKSNFIGVKGDKHANSKRKGPRMQNGSLSLIQGGEWVLWKHCIIRRTHVNGKIKFKQDQFFTNQLRHPGPYRRSLNKSPIGSSISSSSLKWLSWCERYWERLKTGF